jgi:hypothetical protein
MHIATLTTLTTALLSLTSALPKLPRLPTVLDPRQAPSPASQLIAIAPSSGTCAGAPLGGAECATAAQAVAPLVSSFATYNVTSAAEQAALLAWMAFETADFKYNANHFPPPGTPGQGTRTMMSPGFVKMYAASIPAVAAQAAALTDPAAVLALVQPDAYSFAAAAWFLSTQCSASVRAGLQTGTLAGWQAWVTGCVQTTVTDARTAYWQRAVQALGV